LTQATLAAEQARQADHDERARRAEDEPQRLHIAEAS